jgi:hypothetical protein
MAKETWENVNGVVEVTGFRAGRMVDDKGEQLIWIEMTTAKGKTVPFACSIENALQLAELIQVEAKSPIAMDRA